MEEAGGFQRVGIGAGDTRSIFKRREIRGFRASSVGRYTGIESYTVYPRSEIGISTEFVKSVPYVDECILTKVVEILSARGKRETDASHDIIVEIYGLHKMSLSFFGAFFVGFGCNYCRHRHPQ